MAIPGVQRNVYVPAPRAKKAAPAATVKELPEELRFRTAASVFRTVKWDGAAASEERQPQIDLSEPPDPLSPARLVFAQIPWFGEKRAAPTETQSAHSVNSVLASFKWE